MKFTVITSNDLEPDRSRELLELFDIDGKPIDLPSFSESLAIAQAQIDAAAEAAADALLQASAASDAAAAAGQAVETHRTDKTDVHGFSDADKVLRVSGAGPVAFNLPAPGAASGTPLVAYTPKTQQNLSRPMELSASVGVISKFGQNGHVSLQVAGQQAAPNEAVAPPDNWFVTRGTVACRHGPTGSALDATKEIANGGQMQSTVPIGWWWRLKFEQIAGWQNPTFVYIGAGSYIGL